MILRSAISTASEEFRLRYRHNEAVVADFRRRQEEARSRRSPQALDDAVQIGALKLDPSTRRVTCQVSGVPMEIRLGPTEFRLLHYLLTHPERVHSRAQLLDRVWGDHVFIEERTVDVHIKRLREALSVADCAGMVETVRGAGYRLAALPQAVAG